MSIPNPKVEIGFDLTENFISPDFFTLDSLERGRLDNVEYRLGGTIFYDVTDRVRNFRISRGRPSIFSNFPAAQINVEFNNHDRAFDPLYEDSPFFGNIVPRREIRISSNDIRIFSGWIEDWDLSYTADGNSITTAVGFDSFYILAGQNVTAFTPSIETADERINTILNRPSVAWSTELRDIEPSTQNMGAYPIEDETNALSYLQKVAESEPGLLFVGVDGKIVFRDRAKRTPDSGVVSLGENGIPVGNIQVIYGAENLYNEVTVTRSSGGTAIASDLESQEEYGIRALNVSDLLVETDSQIANIALDYASRFSQPEYRFQSLEIALHKLSEQEKDSVLGFEIGTIVFVSFLPNGIQPSIDKYVQIINIDHVVDSSTHFVTIGFSEIRNENWTLSDLVFGRLSEGNVLARR